MFTQRSRRGGEFPFVTVAAVLLVVAAIATPFIPPSRVHAEETPVRSTRLLNAASALNASGSVVLGAATMPRCRESAFYIVWSAGTNAGAVKVESAVDENYTGTWAPLATVSWAAASSQNVVQITGAHWAIRTRISTAVTGGTVTTWFVCN